MIMKAIIIRYKRGQHTKSNPNRRDFMKCRSGVFALAFAGPTLEARPVTLFTLNSILLNILPR